MRASLRSRLRPALKILLPLAVLALAPFALHGVHFADVGHRIAALPRHVLFVAAAAALAQVAILATRFWMVITRSKRPRWAKAARAFSFGQFVNLYLPARAGDVLRGVVLSKDDARVSVADATGAMLADKGLDVLTLVIVGVVFGRGLLASALASSGHAVAILGGALAAVALAVLVVRRVFPRLFERLRAAAAATWSAARGLFTPKRLALGLGLGVAGWIAELVMMTSLCGGLGLHVGFAQAAAALVVLNLGIAVPVSVANVGAYEAATVVGLAPFGVSPSDALAVGALHHALQIVAVVVPALLFWLRDRVGRARVVAAA